MLLGVLCPMLLFNPCENYGQVLGKFENPWAKALLT